MISHQELLSRLHEELRVATSRSGGPGGQHVNKVSTRVTLRFDIHNSRYLSPVQKTRISQRLATRVTKNGILTLHSQRFRSQEANRTDAQDRFDMLIQEALQPNRVRKQTGVPRIAVEKRLLSKRQRAQTKRQRSKPRVADE